MSESSSQSSSDKQYNIKFMTNIMVPPREQTRHVKILERLVPDPQLSYQSMLVAMLMVAGIAIFSVAVLVMSGGAMLYILPAVLIFLIAGLMLSFVYILPSRNGSMLIEVWRLLSFKLLERARRKSKSSLILKNIGIEEINEKGVIHFDDGDYGVMFLVSGKISMSTLPSVAELNASSRENHLVSRSATSQETLIMSIRKTDLSHQIDYYKSIEDQDSDDQNSLWRRFMAKLTRQYVEENIDGHDIAIMQYLIIRDITEQELEKSLRNFQTSVNAGYYASADRITKRDEVTRVLSEIISGSDESSIVDGSPYYFSPSFVSHAGKYSAVLKLYNRTGANRHMSFSDVIDIVPVDVNEDVTMHMIIKDTLITQSEKQQLIMKNATHGKGVVDDLRENGTDVDNSSANQIVQEAKIEDYDEYESLLSSARPIVAYSVELVLTADSKESIDEQIETLNVLLNKKHDGLAWDSVGGDQYSRFRHIFKAYTPSSKDMTSTAQNYAWLDFSPSAGLIDQHGIPVGTDVMSLTASTSFMDYDNSLHTLGLIAAPSSSFCPLYVDDDSSKTPTVSSVTAQAVANNVVMNGHRAHHIVLNRFDYMDNEMFYRPIETSELFKVYDVASETINPLQGFGSVDDVVKIFSRLLKKIVDIFDVLEDLHLTQDERAIILNALEKFYFNQGLWIADAELYPKRTHIVEIQNPATFPTLGTMINEFSSLARAAARDNRELKADKIDALHAVLSNALTSNKGILGRPTSIEMTDALQVYYDFRNVDQLKMRQVQFLNLIDYVIWTCEPGDVVLIHGAERLYEFTSKSIHESLSAAMDKGIRFVFSFDTVKSTPSRVDDMLDMFSMKGLYYNDLDDGVEFTMIGRCLPEEVDMLEKSLNQNLSEAIRVQLGARVPNQMMIHRRAGDINNFVYVNPVI